MTWASISTADGIRGKWKEIARIVELGEAEAYADFYHSAPADFAARQGVRVERRRHYLAFDGDRPVATGGLFVRHDIGWLGMRANYMPASA
jgi:hypothetical protein